MAKGKRINLAAIFTLMITLLLTFSVSSYADEDITDYTQIIKTRMKYNRGTGCSYFDASLENIGQNTYSAPIRAVIESITDPSVSVDNPDGTTTDGKPYFEYDPEITGGQLAPGNTSEQKEWIFYNPGRRRFNFTVSVWAIDGPPPSNTAPVADAGPDQTVFVGDTVTLDGNGSSDADGDPLTFSWSLSVPSGSGATLSDPTAVMPSFDVDIPGTYSAQLIVNDTLVDSAQDTVDIWANTYPSDVDGDGFSESQGDCNDSDSTIYPGANEIPDNGVDEDCDGKDHITVPDVVGQDHEAAQSTILGAQLILAKVSTANSDTVPPGTVISQNPSAGYSVAQGSLVTLVISFGSQGTAPQISFEVDTAISPSPSELPGFGDGISRPMASLTDESGLQVDFIENELLLVTDDPATLTDFLTRWQGELLFTLDPAGAGMTGISQMHLVRIDTTLANPPALVTDLRVITPFGQGQHRVSSDAGLRLLAAAANETANGLFVVVNWVATDDDFRDRTTQEAATCSGCNGYDQDAYNWSYMNLDGTLNIGVTEAWTALEKTGRLGNKVDIAILDMGFAPDADTPAGLTAHSNVPPVQPPTSPPRVPATGTIGLGDSAWHGTNVLGAAMAVPDNTFGGAGPAGPIADPIVVYTLYDFATGMNAIVETVVMGADIINMSYHARVPASLSWTVIPFNLNTRE